MDQGRSGRRGIIVFGVGAPNILGADKNSTYPFTVKQMGPYKVKASAEQAS